MTDAHVFEGGCLCGTVRWQATGQPLHAGHCHCRQCQRQSGAAFITGVTFPAEAVAWTSTEPDFYQSSENSKRGFCSRCGSWLSWHWLDEKVMLTVGSFDHPEEAIEPTSHEFTETQLPWLKLDDGLPRYPRLPSHLEGEDQGL